MTQGSVASRRSLAGEGRGWYHQEGGRRAGPVREKMWVDTVGGKAAGWARED